MLEVAIATTICLFIGCCFALYLLTAKIMGDSID